MGIISLNRLTSLLSTLSYSLPNYPAPPTAFTTHLANPRIVATVRGDSKVSGTVTFEQADENSSTTISWNLTGNDANAQRGIHVHQFGDNTNGCTSAGPHCELISNIPPIPSLLDVKMVDGWREERKEGDKCGMRVRE